MKFFFFLVIMISWIIMMNLEKFEFQLEGYEHMELKL